MRPRLWLLRYDLPYQIHKRIERLLMAFVWKLPKRLVYWCAIRLIAYATTGAYENTIVPELTAMDALKRWNTA